MFIYEWYLPEAKILRGSVHLFIRGKNEIRAHLILTVGLNSALKLSYLSMHRREKDVDVYFIYDSHLSMFQSGISQIFQVLRYC